MPEAPKEALRSVVAGIGRILNFADKVRGKSAGSESAEAETSVDGTAPAAAETEAAEPETATPEAATPEAAEPEAPAAEAAEPKSTAAETAAPGTAAGEEKPDTAADEDEIAASEPAAELPLQNYDELTIQSVRARLRNLSVAQLRQLIEYEKGHADRTEFITAFERRIAKVESGS